MHQALSSATGAAPSGTSNCAQSEFAEAQSRGRQLWQRHRNWN